MINENLVHEAWSKKRIIIGLVTLAILLGGAYGVKKYIFKDKSVLSSLSFPEINSTKVAGVSTKNDSSSSQDSSKDQPLQLPVSSNLKTGMEQKLEDFKKEVSGLNVSDLASSSPQIKKVIEDIQGLQQLPKNQAKEACYNICKGL